MRSSGVMSRRPTWTQTIAICLIIAAFCTIITGYILKTDYEARLSEKLGDYSKLEEIRALIDEKYVGLYTQDELMDMLSVGFLSGINDKWAYYTSAEDYASLMNQKNGSYAGIGVSVTLDSETGMLSVLDVYEGSPAEAAGIKVLDKLYMVGDRLVSELGMEATAALVKGEVGTTVNLTIWRDGVLYKYDVERQQIEQISVRSELIDGEIGYIRISQFTTNAADQFVEKIENLVALDAKSLIIDVRNNPGGSLTTLLTVLDKVMPEGKLFIERDKAGNEQSFSSDSQYIDLPLVVLANGHSYSAAEYLAAVTQEQGRAYIIGLPTTGKGEGQQTFRLQDGSAVTFSTIKYFTPNGMSIGEQGGIKPDLEVEMSYEKTSRIGSLEYSEDPQIMAAVEYLKPAQ